MQSPPLHLQPNLQPFSTSHYFVSGDVTVLEGAAIAAGVLLQADPGSQVVIGPGVCLGVGTVIHARGNGVTIGQGTIVGAGVLIAGELTIGDRACIGAATTVFNYSIAAAELVAPNSLLAESIEPEPTVTSAPTSNRATPDPVTDDPWAEPQDSSNGQPPAPPSVSVTSYSNCSFYSSTAPTTPSDSTIVTPPPELNNGASNGLKPESESIEEVVSEEESDHAESPNRSAIAPIEQNLNPGVYGQVYVNQLLGKLFPGKNSSDSSSEST